VPPPDRVPLPRRKDVPRLLCELIPLLPGSVELEERFEGERAGTLIRSTRVVQAVSPPLTSACRLAPKPRRRSEALRREEVSMYIGIGTLVAIILIILLICILV
jgi:hypothetical protein